MDLTSEVLEQLGRPFTVAAIRFKPLTNPDRASKVLVAFYVDARLVAARLNDVVGPGRWSESYSTLFAASAPQMYAALHYPVQCKLTVCGIDKTDVGCYQSTKADDLAVKAAYSDAFKRAAVKHQVGAFLYAIPKVKVKCKTWTPDGSDKPKFDSYEGGDTAVRAIYQRWLENTNVNVFGEPLDHGDRLADDAEATA
jgi:hypothetical protein